MISVAGNYRNSGPTVHFFPVSPMAGRAMLRPFARHPAAPRFAAPNTQPVPGGSAATSTSMGPGLAPDGEGINPAGRPFPLGAWNPPSGGWRRGGPPIRAHAIFIARGDALAVEHAGLALMGVGLILVLPRIARIGLAFLERRYTTGPMSGSVDGGAIGN